MYNLHDCCTEHGICSILGRMPNRIKYTISCLFHIFQLLDLANKVAAICFPVMKDYREEEQFVVPEESSGRVDLLPKVTKYQQ